MLYIIEDFKKEHFPQVKELIHKNFSTPWSDENILFETESSIKKVILDINQTVIAFVDGYTVHDEADLLLLVVKKDFRRKGFGELLLKTFIDDVKEKNVKNVFLEVSETNIPAISLYKKYGFKIYGKRKDYYGKGQNAILMKLELNGSR